MSFEPQNNVQILSGIKRKSERKLNEPTANSSHSCISKLKYSEMNNKLKEYACRKPDEIRIQQKSFFLYYSCVIQSPGSILSRVIWNSIKQDAAHNC
jgi:hypothetical protein